MRNNFLIFTFSILLFTYCRQSKDEQNPEVTILPDEILFDANDQRILKISTQRLTAEEFPDTIFCTGVVQAPPQSIFSVYSLVRGFVQDIGIYPGSPVKKGQTLCKISHPDIYTIQQRFLSDYQQFKIDSLEYIRQIILFKDSATSERQVQLSKGTYLNSMANYMAQKKFLSSIGFNVAHIQEGNFYSEVIIRSPTDGVVSSVFTNSGVLIESNTLLFTILNTSHIHFEIYLQPSEYQKVKNVSHVYVSSLSDPEIKKAEIVNISNFIENSSMSIVLHCHLTDKLKTPIIGETLSSFFLTEYISGYSVPRHSVFHLDGKDYVFIQKSKLHFGLKEVIVRRKYPSCFIVEFHSEEPLLIVIRGAELLKEKLLAEN